MRVKYGKVYMYDDLRRMQNHWLLKLKNHQKTRTWACLMFSVCFNILFVFQESRVPTTKANCTHTVTIAPSTYSVFMDHHW